MLLDRPGNLPLTDVDRSSFTVVQSFSDISLVNDVVPSIKRKLNAADEIEVNAEAEVTKKRV